MNSGFSKLKRSKKLDLYSLLEVLLKLFFNIILLKKSRRKISSDLLIKVYLLVLLNVQNSSWNQEESSILIFFLFGRSHSKFKGTLGISKLNLHCYAKLVKNYQIYLIFGFLELNFAKKFSIMLKKLKKFMKWQGTPCLKIKIYYWPFFIFRFAIN